VIDHEAYPWRATNWRGRPWQEAVIVEAHVGTFTQEGSYRAMIDRLDHLAETGITALELMPLADFAGSRNWGYDGVLWYAPDSAYGRPEDLKALIDAAHLRGLMVMLDVVYNHFGPEGNYLGRYAPSFFTEAQTPWGSAIDYRVKEVRAFAIENALSWLRDYRFDGLRLDAVNSIVEPGGLSLLHDISAAAGKLAAETGRHIHLVLENGDNRASILDAAEDPPAGKISRAVERRLSSRLARADDRREAGLLRRLPASPISDIARSLSSGFVYQGEPSAFRGGKRGEPSGHLAPTAFINFVQNHDQIGNRALGDRLESAAGRAPSKRRSRCCCCRRRFPCCSWARNGARRRPSRSSAISAAISPMPSARAAASNCLGLCGIWRRGPRRARSIDPRLRRARLERARRARGTKRLTLVRSCLKVRRQQIVPRLAAPPSARRTRTTTAADGHWRMGDGATLRLLANLSDQAISHAPASRGNPDLGQRVGRQRPAMDGALAHRIGKCPRRSRSRPTACNCRRISISTPPLPWCLT
jgi:maltooligosyltrehalose trehalohydrolase